MVRSWNPSIRYHPEPTGNPSGTVLPIPLDSYFVVVIVAAAVVAVVVAVTLRAYIYVGVYGMSYLEAGKSVFELFKNRGWEAIIADDLVGNALGLVSVIVGAITGALSVSFVTFTDWFDEAGDDDKIIAFFIGLIIGLAICSILLSTVASGVNTVIVMFADAPADLQRNYPDISHKMRETWSQVYPGSV
jgi:Plasma-membrane choline transporter